MVRAKRKCIFYRVLAIEKIAEKGDFSICLNIINEISSNLLQIPLNNINNGFLINIKKDFDRLVKFTIDRLYCIENSGEVNV